MSASVQTAELVYDAASEILSGTIGNNPSFFMTAYSGGSRGHKASVAPNLATAYLHNQAGTLSSRMATTPEKKDAQGHYKQRGGTLPPGITCAAILPITPHSANVSDC